MRLVRIDVINTGAELMLGRVLNTHQQWICRQLTDNGYGVRRQVAVDDTSEAIQESVNDALGRADIIIVTGGLGPTSDDRTRDVISAIFGRELHEDKTVLAEILKFFEQRRRQPPETVKVQALVPEGAIVLPNANGTAPGLILTGSPLKQGTVTCMLIMLPGPPRELRPMFLDQVLPLLRQNFPPNEPFVCRTLKTTGLGESFLEEKIAGPVAHLLSSGLELGYCARTGEVDLRFVARGSNAQTIVAEAEKIARAVLGDIIFGSDDDQLENVVIRLLTERKQTLCLAESCTGGYIANRLTNVPGASAVLLGGIVTYSNETKQMFLGVTPEALAEHGAVSNPIARQMAEGVRQRMSADFAISVTGIAGPSGGTETKPVGTVFIGLATSKGTDVRHHRNNFDRETFKYVTSQQALETLRRGIQ
jgi:nicotinamide-nucleotide amidase